MTSVAATQFLPVVSTVTTSGRSLVVSLHDVAPATWEAARHIISELQHSGIRACSLLVVPNYHRCGPSMQNRSFVEWLRELQDAGNEIVLHGYFHQRPRRPDESVFKQLLTRIYTQDEGEFYDIAYDEALLRVRQAQAMFTAAGLKPRGFIAPAWLLSPEGERAARDCELEYTTRLRSVLDLRSGRAFTARSLVYSVRNSWRRTLSLAWNGALFQIQRENQLLRLSIHPPDHGFPEIWRQIERFIEEVRETRTATTYGEWVAEQRLQTAA